MRQEMTGNRSGLRRWSLGGLAGNTKRDPLNIEPASTSSQARVAAGFPKLPHVATLDVQVTGNSRFVNVPDQATADALMSHSGQKQGRTGGPPIRIALAHKPGHCSACGQPGHSQRKCVQCKTCRAWGHTSTLCPHTGQQRPRSASPPARRRRPTPAWCQPGTSPNTSTPT